MARACARARRQAGRDGAASHCDLDCPPKTAATRCCSRRCARTSAGITSRAGRSCWWRPSTENGAARVGPRARGHACDAAPRARAARASGARSCYPVSDHLAQSRPDPRDGAARHSGPLSRLLRRRVLDHHQSAAADADLLLRVRRRAARPLRSQRHAGGASRSTSWRACCRGWRSAKPPGARPA